MATKKSKFQSPALRFNLFDWGLVAVAIITSVVAILDHHDSPLYLIADIITLDASVLYMILSAKGRRSNFIFCIVGTLTYIYLAWINQFYGSLALNLFYYIPCAIIGFYLWGRNSNKNHEVKARKLTRRQLIMVIALSVATSILFKFTLDALGGASTTLDSTATMVAIVANLLVLLRYREQWLFWLATDILQLVMWTNTDDPIMIVMRLLYPITAVYGYINWRKLVKLPRKSAKARKRAKLC